MMCSGANMDIQAEFPCMVLVLAKGSDGESNGDNKKHRHTAKVSKFFEHGKWLFRDTDARVGKFKTETRKALVSHWSSLQ